MEQYIKIFNLKVAVNLKEFVQNELLKDLDISPEIFWGKFDKAVHELAEINSKLIKKREDLQKKVDEWHKSKRSENFDLMIKISS